LVFNIHGPLDVEGAVEALDLFFRDFFEEELVECVLLI
jgi:hypothetical protein